MKIKQIVSENEVYSSWLQSELYRVRKDLSQADIDIIEQPNLYSTDENSRRKDMLFNHPFGRSAILNHLPTSIVWKEAELMSADIDNLYIIPVFDWFLDSGKSFRLRDVPSCLAPNRGYFINGSKREVFHHKSIHEMAEILKQDIKGKIVLLSSNNSSHFTIIDGTHRASRLLLKNELIGTACLLGLAENLSNCIWSIERTDFEAEKSKFNHFHTIGALW